MNFFEQFVYFLSSKMPTPQPYGWFHLLSIAIVIALTIVLCMYCKNASNKTFKIIVWSAWGLCFILEVFKQLIFSFNYNETTGVVSWSYQWYMFPYQLCSAPLYLLPIIALLKDGKVRDTLMACMSTFVLFGGLITMILPSQVFLDVVTINIQTMVHHGLQIVLGIYFIVYNRKKLDFKYFLRGIIVFGILVAVALLLDVIIFHLIPSSQVFNMYYISPYYACPLILLDKIYAAVPYVVFLGIYILGFVLAAFLIYLIFYYINKLCIKLGDKKAQKKEKAIE